MIEVGSSQKLQQNVRSVLTHSVLILVSLTCLFPLFWMVISSLKTQETIFSNMSMLPWPAHFENFPLAWIKGRFGVFFLNSLFYTFSTVVGVLLIASLAAYAFARLPFPGRKVIYVLFLSTMMIPVPGAFIALYVLLIKLDLVNTRLGYILPQINGGLALGIFLLKTFFDKLPRDLEDAARVDGCNKFQVYYLVALPLAKPAIAVLAIFTTLSVWNEYLLGMLILSDRNLMPLQRGLMVFQGAHVTEYPLLMAGMTISVIPVLLIYILMQRHIISGITAGALKM